MVSNSPNPTDVSEEAAQANTENSMYQAREPALDNRAENTPSEKVSSPDGDDAGENKVGTSLDDE